MWTLENHTPFAADRTWVLDKDGAKRWVVVVKGTYDLQENQRTCLSETQPPPLLLPTYRGEPGASSLLHVMDLTAPKLATDVVVNALAHAPGGKPTTVLDVSLQVGALKKQLRVFGDREWKRAVLGGPAMSAPRPFVTLPVCYERAFGGWDRKAEDAAEHRVHPDNPVGTGFVTQASHSGEVALPNVESPRHLIRSWKDRPPLAGLGAIPSDWSPRRELAGTCDERWKKTRFPLLPEDFDERFHQCAPVDQQVPGFLKGGERVELVNLSRWSRLGFELPKVWLAFKTFFGRKSVEHRARLHTVILEPELPQVTLVWHTSLSCHHDADKLDVTVINQKEYLSMQRSA
ncbi:MULTISPECIES: DUF2169 family type VI secretion system accessory protein [Myxococcus]|uniref:DUF2169 family type VI secretion system accessory protein n=1 Tax=Myxococcus TaxID=32 RepID=UPI0013D796C0|nr:MULTISPECIES: DUF2169 domain-containing protein [Myxococcus]NVJ26292.1 DUF2169 domain-containing protein [Myxococcus sp. AM011]